MNLVLIHIWILFVYVLLVKGNNLESVSDDDLIEFIKSKENVVVLFAKKDCAECDKYEGLLINLKDEFKEQLDAVVLKVVGSQMARLYNPSKESSSSLVYFRHGIPLLYYGSAHADSILQQFIENKTPVVKELSDDSFEHLTQASTGGTTGDWFVMFYSPECVDCQRLNAIWEGVGAAIRNRVNVARINRLGPGLLTAKRFSVTKSPEFIYIRHGKFYRYDLSNYDIKSFLTFIKDWYRNSRAEKIVLPITPFDSLVDVVIIYLRVSIDIAQNLQRDHPYVFSLSVLSFCFVLIATILRKLCSSAPNVKQKKK